MAVGTRFREAAARFDEEVRTDRRTRPAVESCVDEIRSLVLSQHADAEFGIHQRNIGEYWFDVRTDRPIRRRLDEMIRRRAHRLLVKHHVLLAVLDHVRDQERT